MKKPDVHSYHNYQDFIRDSLEFVKKKRGLSQKEVAETCGVSAALLTMVVKGKRQMTPVLLENLAYVFKLSTSEKNFFNHLRILKDSSSLESRKNTLKRMSGFKKYRGSNKEEVVNFAYLSKWYHSVIRELVGCSGFQDNVEWIQEKLHFKVSKKNIADSLEFLKKENFIRKNKSGIWIQSEKNLHCVGEVFKVGLTEVHKQMFGLAIDSIDTIESGRRRILGKVLPVSNEHIDEVFEIIEDAMAKIESLQNEESQKNKSVLQVSMSAFPLTKKDKDKSND